MSDAHFPADTDTVDDRRDRLRLGFWTMDDQQAADDGGLGDDGHVKLPYLLQDVGVVAQQVGFDAQQVAADKADVAADKADVADMVAAADIANTAAADTLAATLAAAETAMDAAVAAAAGHADSAADSAGAAAAALATANLPAMAAGETGKSLVWGGSAWDKGGPYATAAAMDGKAAAALTNVSNADFAAKAAAAGVGGGFGNPMTSPGDLIVGGVGGEARRLALGMPGQVLTAGAGSVIWSDVIVASPPAGWSERWTAQSGVNTAQSDVWIGRAGIPLSQATVGSRPAYITHLGVQCLDFDGVDDVLSATIPTINGQTTYSFCLLIRADLTTQGHIFLIEEAGSWGTTSMSLGAGGFSSFRFGTGGAVTQLSGVFSAQSGWFLLTATFDNGTWTLYINRSSVATSAQGTILQNHGTTLKIGGGASYFNGKIAEIITYNAALSPQGIGRMCAYLNTLYGLSL